MANNKMCKYYIQSTYATCSSCNIDGKYTSCYGNKDKCKYRPSENKNAEKK